MDPKQPRRLLGRSPKEGRIFVLRFRASRHHPTFFIITISSARSEKLVRTPWRLRHRHQFIKYKSERNVSQRRCRGGSIKKKHCDLGWALSHRPLCVTLSPAPLPFRDPSSSLSRSHLSSHPRGLRDEFVQRSRGFRSAKKGGTRTKKGVAFSKRKKRKKNSRKK